MSNKEFKDRLNKIVNEAIQFGSKMMPVDNATWPDTSSAPEIPAQDIPSTTQSVVTSGETTPMGEPRADVVASNTGTGKLDQESMAEVASLLITIGFILQKAGCVDDKYNNAAVISYLGDNFVTGCSAPSPEVSGTVIAVEPAIEPTPVVPAAVPEVAPVVGGEVEDDEDDEENLPSTQVGPAALYEARKLLEAKFKK